MRDTFSIVFVLLLIAVESTFWVRNPMHIPASFVPARAFGIQLFQQLDSSMEPMVPAGERILVSSWTYWHGEPQVGDIIAYQYPSNPNIADLKRVVAIGGSTVAIRHGTTYVDGKPLVEPYLPARSRFTRDSLEMAATRVPAGSYFVMGDNRDGSRDSRDYGPISRDKVMR
jgi:signal peptidase I